MKKKYKYIIHIGAEAYPFYKKGGLGDVLGALPAYLQKYTNINNVVITPFYKNISHVTSIVREDVILFNGIEYTYKIHESFWKNVHYIFIENEEAFSWDEIYMDGNKPYQCSVGLQYFIFAKSVVHFLEKENYNCYKIVTHDWHVCGIYGYLKKEIDTLHIIHNYNHQGELYYDICEHLEKELLNKIYKQYEDTGYCNMSLFAIYYADDILTVSPNYANELYLGEAPHVGLECLKLSKNKIHGILNGIDDSIWNPKLDNYISYKYDEQSFELKFLNKDKLLKEYGIENVERPLVIYISRLTSQKGIDLFVNIKNGKYFNSEDRIRGIINCGVNLIICGTPSGGIMGDIDCQLKNFENKYRKHFKYINNYTEKIAHNLFAAADIFLMPSRYEPCGLTQMYAMKYGTIPLSTQVGGLKDTIINSFENMDKGTGFFIEKYSYDSMLDSLKKSVKIYYHDKNNWSKIIKNGMNKNNSWMSRMQQYVEFFK